MRLKADTTTVYLAHAPDFAPLAALLSPEEQARAAGISLPGPRARAVAARALVRTVLGTHLGANPHELRFGQGEHGKPYLLQGPEPARLHFNLSHTGDLLALALGAQPLGVDVEAVRPLSPALISMALGPLERARLQARPAGEYGRAFYRAWACKEALLKAHGSGLAFGLQRVQLSVPADLNAAPLVEAGPRAPADDWTLQVRWLGSAHILAVAATAPGLTLQRITPVCARTGHWAAEPLPAPSAGIPRVPDSNG
ncbi:4'-phosphopantetheinyl transferase family protein [Deinococcus aquaedulcis]|uniref:4'-phosphopantetheinyl transferase family protein n=1 Tax=Deinococcus aquaedulcis TaxID=2840455 RepID=UPI001C8311F1|nr:4'-phosphopantetheinyl transferase superfamily protein [Deinococcus aquaedulcis]